MRDKIWDVRPSVTSSGQKILENVCVLLGQNVTKRKMGNSRDVFENAQVTLGLQEDTCHWEERAPWPPWLTGSWQDVDRVGRRTGSSQSRTALGVSIRPSWLALLTCVCADGISRYRGAGGKPGAIGKIYTGELVGMCHSHGGTSHR